MNLLLVEKNKQKDNVRFEIAHKERKSKTFHRRGTEDAEGAWRLRSRTAL